MKKLHALRRSGIACAIAAAMTTGFAAAPLHAQGIPTIDIAGLAESIVQYVAQLEGLDNELMQIQQLYQQIQVAQSTFAQAQADYQSISGYRNLGDLMNSVAYQAARNYTPADLERALLSPQGVTGTRAYSAELQSLIDQYNKSTSVYSDRSQFNNASASAFATLDIEKTADSTARIATNRAAQAAESRVADIQTMKDRVNQNPDQKSVLDFQANLQAESLMLQNEMLQVQLRRDQAAQQLDILKRQREEEAIAAAYRSYDPTAMFERSKAQTGQQ